MTILELQNQLSMTENELIEHIKLQGQAVYTEDSVFGLYNNKYVERALLFYDDHYFVTYSILDTYLEIFYFEEIEIFKDEYTAHIGYDSLLINLNGTL